MYDLESLPVTYKRQWSRTKLRSTARCILVSRFLSNTCDADWSFVGLQ